MKCMGKITDAFGRLKFRLPQNIPFQPKFCTTGRASKIVIDASFGCHCDFKAEKYSIAFLEFKEYLNENA